MTVALDETLDDIASYVTAVREFLGSPQAAAEDDELEECLRMRAADAGASAAVRAADEAVVPSLRDFLGDA